MSIPGQRNRFVKSGGSYDRAAIMQVAHSEARTAVAAAARQDRQTTYRAELAKALTYVWSHAGIAFRAHPANLPGVLATCRVIAPFAEKPRFSLRPIW